MEFAKHDGVKFWIVKPCGKHADIGYNFYFPGFEFGKYSLTVRFGGIRAYNGAVRNLPAMDAIKSAVNILTAGKGQVIKIEKL